MNNFFHRQWLRILGRARFPHALVYGSVQTGAEIGESVWIPHGTSVSRNCRIGRCSYIMPPCRLTNIEIGNFCSLGEKVTFLHFHHNPEAFSTFPFSTRLQMHGVEFPPLFVETLDKGQIKIGHDVWVGANSCIMGGITIGTGAIIGAGSLVTKDVAPYTIVGGVPAKVIRTRFSNAAVEKLLASQWWNWSLDEIRSRADELTALTRS